MKKVYIMLAVFVVLIMMTGCELLGITIPETTTIIATVSKTSSEDEVSESSAMTSTEQTTTSDTITETTEGSDPTTQTLQTGETMELLVYYTDIEGYVVPVTISVEKTFQVAAESFEHMIKNSENFLFASNYGLIPILPEGTEISSIEIEDGIAYIDFNSKILNYSTRLEEYNIFSSVIYLLTGFSSVDSVEIKIDGNHPGELKHGTLIDRVLKREDILINSNKFLKDNSKQKYDIYFLRLIENREYLVPLSVEFSEISKLMMPGKMLEVMISDYEDYNLFSAVPKETKVVETSIDENGTLEVILSKELTGYGGGSAKEIALLDQLLYTFSGIEGVRRVKLTIDQSDDILPEGTELTEPFAVSKYINILDQRS
jgi:germination protein M